jgi:hypothetical protein
MQILGGRHRPVRDHSLLAALGEAFTFAITAVSGYVQIVFQLFAFWMVALRIFHCACASQLHLGTADTPLYFTCNHRTPENLKLILWIVVLVGVGAVMLRSPGILLGPACAGGMHFPGPALLFCLAIACPRRRAPGLGFTFNPGPPFGFGHAAAWFSFVSPHKIPFSSHQVNRLIKGGAGIIQPQPCALKYFRRKVPGQTCPGF